MTVKSQQPQSLDKLESLLDQCMVRDRFRLRRQFGKIGAARIQRGIDQSMAKAIRRSSLHPKVDYPDNLPITDKLADIKAALQQHQVLILAGETGSGKTTQLPKLCLDMGRGTYGLIGHTQPRRVAARTVGARIAEELNVTFGQEVGYQVRFTDQSTEDSLIKVMTDGILLAETQHDRFLEAYDTLIIDEAHERSLNIDFLLGYIKRILPKRPDLKVIITSATIDVQRFSRHFGDAPIIEVSGRTYPVDVRYRPPENQDKQEDADERVQQGILDVLEEIEQDERKAKRRQGDVLVFLAGEREIRDVAQVLRKAQLRDTEVLPLYSRLSVAEQNRIFQSHRGRRIILSTNVAETSLTVPGIRYVIDPGLARISRYSVRSKVQQLPIEPVSKASADQRKGRCGRVSEGICFRLYSEEDFDSRPEFTAPEILRTNLAAVILQMLVLRLGDITRFPFLEKPDQRQINDGYHLLKELCAVDDKRGITKMGKDIVRLPIDLRLARMLLEASRHFALNEVLVIVSALAVQDPRDRPHDHQQKADEAHRRYADDDSDFVAYLNLWRFFEEHRQALSQRKLRSFCKENFLSYARMREWRDIHRQLHLMCREMKMKENRQPADFGAVHRSLLSGLLGQIGEKQEGNEYLGARGKRHFIFPGSALFRKRPAWIMSAELTETTRLYGRTVASIDNDWVEPLAQHLVSRTFHEPHYESKRGQIVARERVTLYGLVIVKNRTAEFGAIDPKAARQIFIQSALVEGQIRTNAPFYQHNRQLIKDIEALESKTRRRDILVDDHLIYQFYDERLPAEICCDFDLNEFLKSGLKQQSKRLHMTRDALVNADVNLSVAAYPDQMQVRDTQLKLDYRFDPQHKEDGVSVNLPLSLLNQVPDAQFDWLIPGLLREKCLGLIKSLPKSIRKNFVPAPATVDRVLENFEYDGRDLSVALGERLFRLTGVKIPKDAWRKDAIDSYLQLNIKVVDARGKMLGAGRNLEELKRQFSDSAEDSFRTTTQHSVEKKGLTDWDFGELPVQVETRHGKFAVTAYPALVDKTDSVAIEVVDTVDRAEQLSRLGLLRLCMLRVKDQVKYLNKNIPGFTQLALLYVTRGKKAELQSDLVEAICRYTFIEGLPEVRSRKEFDERLRKRAELVDCGNEVAELLQQVFGSAHEVGKQLEHLAGQGGGAAYGRVIDDIRLQMAHLIGPGFLRRTPFEWLKQFPRYLKAVQYRLDKLQGSLPRQESAITEFDRFWQRYIEQLEQNKGQTNRAFDEHRWMLEEFRVSLFAQPLGTKVPISSKRLEKHWETCQIN